jgi:hypothetical protein
VLSAANAHLDGRGADINVRGMKLYAESVTDLAGEAVALHREARL